MDEEKHLPNRNTTTFIDLVIKVMNFIVFLFFPRKVTNFRWANTARDTSVFMGEFSPGQYTAIYGRITSKYKYHPQQRYENAVRRFDIADALKGQMEQDGNLAFYKALLEQNNLPEMENYGVDLTKIGDLSTVSASGDYLYREICSRKDKNAAQVARRSYVRGFSRVVDAMDYEDWKNLRTELWQGKHLGAEAEDIPGDNVILLALSYKGKSVQITRRMRIVNEDGTPKEDEGVLAQSEVEITSDFVDDFRWSQVVRSCMAIAKQRGTTKIRLWIDRLVMMGLSKEERGKVYELVDWEEFGLFAYAVCPVIRVYNAEEPLYGTDFWRKLETVLGVAGRGIVVDDYMLRKYDDTIYFGASMYQRLDNGISSIGGTGRYLRSVTLALATAVLTDGVTVSASNEDLRTVQAASAWKAWALRTIAEGAYSQNHTSMMRKEKAFVVAYHDFLKIAFWESIVSQCSMLIGKSYLDMSYQRSMSWRKCSTWDGVLEWIGMFPTCCEVRDRAEISEFLKKNALLSMWTSTTGHVASIITLRSPDVRHKRCLVVDLARFSTVRHGHVVAVAEATGLWAGSILPQYLRFDPDPDRDQTATINMFGVQYSYTQMEARLSCFPRWMKRPMIFGLLILFSVGCFVLAGFSSLWFIAFGFLNWVIAGLWYFAIRPYMKRPWPWVDKCDVGEAVFDNLLLHALYGSGIKNQYRNLRAEFRDIGWN